MKKHLNILNTVAEYQEYSASTAYSKPNVTYVRENKVLYYDYGNNKPQADMSSYKGEFQDISVGGNYYGKSAITKINYIPNGITGLTNAFSDYLSLEEVTCDIPISVTSMNYTFNGCSSLVNAQSVIPSGVKNLNYTFGGCSSLVTAPEIPSGVTNLNSTFVGCSSLVNAPNIPSSVTSMDSTFSYCRSLKEVTLLHTTPPTYNNTLKNCSSLESIYVPDSALEDYRTATGWLQFADKIKPLSSKPSE